MAKNTDKFDEELDEDFELPDDDAYDRPEDEEAPVAAPVSQVELRVTVLSILASCGMFVYALLRTTLGMYRSDRHFQLIPVGETIHVIECLMLINVVAILLGASAMKVTRAHDGTILRGVAIAAAAISFVNELLLGNSLFELLSNVR